MPTASRDRLETIRSGPHWRILIRPQPYIEARVAYEDLLSTIDRTRVRYRGWYFPHQNPHEQQEFGKNYVGSSDDFYGHLEYWRFYTSGQFLYLGGVREATEPAWREKLEKSARFRVFGPATEQDWSKVPGYFDVVNFVYILTEVWEFAARLGQALADVEAMEVSLGVHNIEGFVLTVDDFRRGELHGYYASGEPVLERAWLVSLSDLVSQTSALAAEASRWFFLRFGWIEPNMERVRSDIEELRGHRS